MSEQKLITIEETLASDAIDAAFVADSGCTPFLIMSEVLEGARRPLIFLQVVSETFDLIGAVGYTIRYLLADPLTAASSTEANMLAHGMSAEDKGLSAVNVSVPDVIYSAVELSDFLFEDFPNISHVRLHLRNMGKAVMEYLDAAVKTCIAGATDNYSGQSASNLTYDAVIDALAAMENSDWIPDPTNPPFLIIAPDAAANVMKDTTFIATERYTTYEIASMVQGELGRFAGCRVLKSSLMDGVGYAYIVFPDDINGVVVSLAWKRRLTVKNEREEKYGYTYFVTTIRAACAVIQSKGICKIQLTSSP